MVIKQVYSKLPDMVSAYVICGWEVRIEQICDRGLFKRVRGHSVFTDLSRVSKWRIYFSSLSLSKQKRTKSRTRYRDREQIQGNPDRANNQSDCRIRYRALLENSKRDMLNAAISFFKLLSGC